jgi:undecaprenyl-diphosphatase
VLTYFQAIFLGLLQGVTELFPISSLGHSVLLPALFGWHNLVNSQSANESFFLAFLVGLHVGTACGLIVYYRRDWVEIIGGLVTSTVHRKIETPVQRLGWLLVVATIPAGITGLALEHELRRQFAKPLSAAIFLTINGVILLLGEVIRRRSVERHRLARGELARAEADGGSLPAAVSDEDAPGTRKLDTFDFPSAVGIGVAQIAALFAGISRSGITMVAGLLRGLDHEDAARFSFLLATPIILAAGLLKIPDLAGPLGHNIHGQIIAGTVSAGVAAYFSVRFLVRWFHTRTLWPFGIYSLVVGGLCIIRFA